MNKLLIVDDERIIVDSLGGYLAEHFDAEVYRAHSALEAMDLLRQMRFDLVITDIHMPIMDGMDLLTFIKRYWPRCYVIMLTAHDNFDYIYRSIRHDHVDYVLKVEGFRAIGRKVQVALECLEKEQSQERLFANIGSRIEKMKPALQADILNRVLKRGEQMPPQGELDSIQFPLKIAADVLIVVAILDTSHPMSADTVFTEITDYIRPRLSQRGVRLMPHQIGCYGIWLLQQWEDHSDEDTILFVLDILDTVPEMAFNEPGMSVFLAVSGQPVPWESLQHVYEWAMLSLERARGQRGVLVLKAEEEQNVREMPSHPSFDQLGALWEMIRTGERAAFMNALFSALSSVSHLSDITAELPLLAVSAISFLYMSAVGMYGLDDLLDTRSQRVLNASGHISGEQWVQQMARLFFELYERKGEAYTNDVTWVVHKVQEYVQAHFREDIHLSMIAAMFHYSPAYLSRMYKTRTGINITAYINSLRITHAREQLETTVLSIQEIAANSGFYSTKYFSQVFKKAIGRTPRQYREDVADE